MEYGTILTYAERFQTFEGYWDNNIATARQLAAIGHVFDRPPLEACDEGSRCISCSAFVEKILSIKALEGSNNRLYEDGFTSFNFHHPSCTRLQVRIPLDPQALWPGLYGGRIADRKRWFEKLAKRRDGPVELQGMPEGASQKISQKSSLLNLPTEIRLEIYSMILPSLDPVTEIVTLNRDSPRVVSSVGFHKTGRRDLDKPNILRTCRAVNEEAMDLIYSHTTFKFESSKIMYLFLRSIGSAGRQVVKSVDILCGGREDAIAFALLASCEKLRAICIRLPRPMLLFQRAPLWIIDGVSALLALNGLEEVTFGSCQSALNYMSDEKPDAAIIRTELSKAKGSQANTRWLKTYLNA